MITLERMKEFIILMMIIISETTMFMNSIDAK
jgi:hypothetical protein